VFEELWDTQDRNPNIHFYETTTDPIEQLRTIAPWDESAALPPPDNGADRSAREIRAGLEEALARADYRRIADRIRAVQFPGQVAPFRSGASAPSGLEQVPPHAPPAFAAHFIAVRVERIARALFEQPVVFVAVRFVGRVLRGARDCCAARRGRRRRREIRRTPGQQVPDKLPS
jgi:hypothetical protein